MEREDAAVTRHAGLTVGTALGAMVLALAWGGGAALAQGSGDAPVTSFDVACLCQNGHDASRFSGEIAVTDANRDALRAQIEAGALDLRRQVVLRAAACAPRPWRRGDAGGCGSSTRQVTLSTGERQTTRAENSVVIGERRIRITDTGNIPTRRDVPEGTIALDPARWARVAVVNVSGRVAP